MANWRRIWTSVVWLAFVVLMIVLLIVPVTWDLYSWWHTCVIGHSCGGASGGAKAAGLLAGVAICGLVISWVRRPWRHRDSAPSDDTGEIAPRNPEV